MTPLLKPWPGPVTEAPRLGSPRLTSDDFNRITWLIHQQCGLDLRRGKELFLSSRLARLTRTLNCESFAEYYRTVVGDSTGRALADLIDAVTTNFTSFWREPAHFDFLRNNIVPGLLRQGFARIWCAAAATGEEPYSISICLLEALSNNSALPVEILASDVSTAALRIAERGVYRSDRLHPLTRHLVEKYFIRGEGDFRHSYRVGSQVSRPIQFRRVNLVERIPDVGSFGAIFCRNVMIYFDQPTQIATVRRLVDRLDPGGYLIVGLSESLLGFDRGLTYIRPGVYRRACRAGGRRGLGRT